MAKIPLAADIPITVSVAFCFGIPLIVRDHGMAPMAFLMLGIEFPTWIDFFAVRLAAAFVIGWLGWLVVIAGLFCQSTQLYFHRRKVGMALVSLSWLVFAIASEQKDFIFINSLTLTTSLPFFLLLGTHFMVLSHFRLKDDKRKQT